MSAELQPLPDSAMNLLDAGLAQLGLCPALAMPLSRYARLLLLWNRTYNLTAIRDPQAIVTKHLLDCLAMAPYVATGPLADVGSGAGLPGIPLALALPELRVSLIETAGKKARFLREAVRELGLTPRVTIHAERAESVAVRQGFDQLCARAFGSFEEIVRVGGHLMSPAGRVLAMKGRRVEVMAESIPAGWRLEICHSLSVPGLDAERHLAVLVRQP